MYVTYPNLELIEYKVKQLLAADEEFMSKLGKKRTEFDMIVFPQIWGNTCTGFDVCSDGSPAVGGCAMTKEYTTVVHEITTATYIVCFGNQPCYKVTDPTDDFFSDLSARRMASLSESQKRY